MRILLDENLPHDLVAALTEHQVATVKGMGWAGVQNGELLRRASGHIDAFITMDRNLSHQQRLAGLPFGVVVLAAPSSRVRHVLPLVPAIRSALEQVLPGSHVLVGA